MNKRQLFRSLSVVAAGLGGFTHLAGAVDYSWGGTSGNWTVNSNWSPNTGNPSATTDTATIRLAASCG